MNETISPELGQLLKIARERNQALRKTGFVDLSAQGGGQMPPMPGSDPMAGPVPPVDPMAAMGVGGGEGMGAGMDAGAPLTEDRVRQLIQEGQAAGTSPMGGAPGEGEAAKKKVDVNTEIYHIKKLLCYLLDQLGLEVPPTTLLGDPAEDPQAAPEEALNDPASAGAAPESAIKPIQTLQGASPALAAGGGGEEAGAGGLAGLAGKAGALARVLRTEAEK